MWIKRNKNPQMMIGEDGTKYLFSSFPILQQCDSLIYVTPFFASETIRWKKFVKMCHWNILSGHFCDQFSYINYT